MKKNQIDMCIIACGLLSVAIFGWQCYSHPTRWEAILEQYPSLGFFNMYNDLSQEELEALAFYKNTVWRLPALWYLVSIIGLGIFLKRRWKGYLTLFISLLVIALAIIGLFYSLYIGFDVYGKEADF